MAKGTMTLLNGAVLDCYPLKHPETRVDNELKLDTTGKYLSIGISKHRRDAASKNDEERKTLFLNNAFLFLQNKDRIMSDSRMFLCSVPIQNGLAYTGTAGFNHPTLGLYLEWWLSCEKATILKEDKTKWLVYFISGSPLSGANKCGIVNEKGEIDSECLYPFPLVWRSFASINKRYDEAKSLYQAYTLEEVVKKLGRRGVPNNLDGIRKALFNRYLY